MEGTFKWHVVLILVRVTTQRTPWLSLVHRGACVPQGGVGAPWCARLMSPRAVNRQCGSLAGCPTGPRWPTLLDGVDMLYFAITKRTAVSNVWPSELPHDPRSASAQERHNMSGPCRGVLATLGGGGREGGTLRTSEYGQDTSNVLEVSSPR